jgi:hypothetical protein
MKKYILALSAGLLSLSVVAAPTFLESVWPINPVKKEALLQKIREHALIENSYLSLGETHLESDSVLRINEELAEEFYQSVGNKKITFCSETLSHFLESQFGIDLQEKSFQVKVFKGNGPSRTDFSKCEDKDSEHYFVYSGNFHQYPFARSFPNDFPKTPVIVDEDNNIRSQMKKSKGLFVTQQELIYLESVALKSLMNEKITDPKEFRSRSGTLLDQIQLIKSQLEVFVSSVNPFEEKKGIILGKEHFKAELFMNDLTFHLITDRSYRPLEESFHFLRKLMLMEQGRLQNFLNYLKDKKIHLAGGIFSPGQYGEEAQTTYIGIPYSFDGLSHLIQTADGIILSQPKNKEFECFNKEAQVVGCDRFFNSTSL